MNASRVVRFVAWIGAAFFVVFGAWAFVSPSSFYDTVALFPPYNEHFLHDAGAFQLGIGGGLVLGLLGWSGLGTALGGAALGAVVHEVSHVLDRDLGGKDSDPIGLGILAVALVVATWLARPGRTVDRR